MREKESLLATIFIVLRYVQLVVRVYLEGFGCEYTHSHSPGYVCRGGIVITASFVGLFQVIRELGYEYVSTSGFF